MSDLISRQAAIDELVKMLSDCFYADEEVLDAVKTTLKELPPALREQHHDEWCDSCKEYDKEKHCCPRWNRVIRQTLQDAKPEPCEDAVSRKAVKDGFDEMCSLICPYTEKQRHIMCGSCLLGTAFDVLEATQPVTPKQRTGHWHITDAYPHNVYCSECHKRFAQTHWAVWEDGSLPRNFCPNCGAKMTEGDAE